jgi:hypothetical protein
VTPEESKKYEDFVRGTAKAQAKLALDFELEEIEERDKKTIAYLVQSEVDRRRLLAIIRQLRGESGK